MIIDPRKRRASRRRRDVQPAPLAAILALAMEISDLSELQGWEPCGSLLMELPAAVSGDGGLSMREIQRLRVWSRNWSALAPALRSFYSKNHGDPSVSSALWFILGSGYRPKSWKVNRAFLDLTGGESPFDLLPPPEHRTVK